MATILTLHRARRARSFLEAPPETHRELVTVPHYCRVERADLEVGAGEACNWCGEIMPAAPARKSILQRMFGL